MQKRKVNYMDGRWHTWKGGDCPVPTSVTVEFKVRRGTVMIGKPRFLEWNHLPPEDQWHESDIIKFRVIAVKDENNG